MTTLPLVIAPNKLLYQKSVAVEKVDQELQKFLDSMLETMYYEHGAGLAAVQVGVLKRIMLIDVGRKSEEQIRDPHFLINPEITWHSEETVSMKEVCLSFPNGYLDIERPAAVTIKYLDYDGNPQEMKEVEGWMARALLHEYDHLEGIVFCKYVSRLKANLVMSKVKKYKKNENDS